jgi:hypothetical protein
MDTLSRSDVRRMTTERVCAPAADGKTRIERKAGLYCRTRLIRLTEVRQGNRQEKMGIGAITVSLDTSPEPRDRLGVSAFPELGEGDVRVPLVYSMIAGRKTKRLAYVAFGLLGTTYETLGPTDVRVHPSQISIPL